MWNSDPPELVHSFYSRQDSSKRQHFVASFVSDETTVFRPRVLYLKNPFLAQLELEPVLERFLLVSPSPDRICERNLVFTIVEIECLVNRIRKTVQAHQLEETELESLSFASIYVVPDFGPDLASQVSQLLFIGSPAQAEERDFQNPSLIN
jgi:hypothetical protein